MSTKVEVADESSVDSYILQERKEEEEDEKNINIPESDKLIETNLCVLLLNQHQTVQPSEVEKEDIAEKWLKEDDQIKCTQHQETVQPSEAEKDVEAEKLLIEDQILQNQQHETVQPSEVEKEDIADKWLKEDDQIKCTQQQEAGLQETDLPLQVEGDKEDENPKDKNDEKKKTEKLLKEVDTNIVPEASKDTFSTKSKFKKGPSLHSTLGIGALSVKRH